MSRQSQGAETLKDRLGDKAEQVSDLAKEFAHEVVRFAAAYGIRVVGAIFLLVLAWLVSRWVRRGIARALNRPNLDVTFARFVAHSAGWGVLVLAMVACLSIFGVETNALVAGIGAAGIAIGLAMQGSLSNLAAGMMLLVLRPFKVGDTITAAGITGKVESIELFFTRVDTADNRRIFLPNGQIFGSVIDNQTHHHARQVLVTISVEYAADLDRTRQALLRALESVPQRIAQPTSTAVIIALGPSSVDWQVAVWCATPNVAKVKEGILRSCKVALDESGISIPFPQMEVWARQWNPASPLTDPRASRLPRVPPADPPAPDDPE